MFTTTSQRFAVTLAATLATSVLIGGAASANESGLDALQAASPAQEHQVDTLRIDNSTDTLGAVVALSPRLSLHPEASRALSKAARDMKGVKPSLYRGEYFSKRGEDFRRCVIERESRGDYKAANASSSARGAYQFLDNAWRESLVHMMRKEAKENGLSKELKQLNNKPIHKWNRYWQDAAFYTVYNYDGPGSGSHHWGTFGQTYSCH